VFHLVDDSFLVAQIYYLLEPSSATRFFIFFDGGLGLPIGAAFVLQNFLFTYMGNWHNQAGLLLEIYINGIMHHQYIDESIFH
jgi:hypothetical protein